jgi:endonuclease/exonuclease/phosphatase family metal-dependent hydrolase
MFKRTNSRVFVVLLAVLLLIVFTSAAGADGDTVGRQRDGSDRPVTVMTRNLYLGADLSPIFSAILYGSPPLDAAVAQVYGQAMASQIPVRAHAIAGEIAAAQPHLVGLQETVVWSGPLGTFDFLQLILAELTAAGQHYEIVAIAPGFQTQFPTPVGPIGLIVQDVILARADLPVSELKLSNVQTGQYEARVEFPPLIEIPRQWASVDVKSRGKEFRFITTHLESLGPPLSIRYAQAAELLTDPANTSLPVIAVGDFNAEPSAVNDSAWLLINNGFVDSWAAVYPGQSGFTCCHPPDLSGDGSTLVKQIDLILFRGDFDVVTAEIVGDEEGDKTATGIWPSDHAGLVATLLIPKDKD